jgi:hypothetical protein
MDIGRCFKDAWNLLMKDLAPLIVTAIVGSVVVGVVALVMGLAAGGAMLGSGTFTLDSATNEIQVDDVNWGVFVLAVLLISVVALVVGAWEYSTLLKIMLRRVRDGRAATMDDLKLGFEGIGGFIVALIVLGLLIGIGFVFLIIPGLILMTIWAYALVRVADKGSRLGDAMSESTALAKVPGYLMTFVTLLVGGIVVGVVSGILGMIPVIGQILSAFVGLYMIAYIVAMYFQATGEMHLLDHALYDQPLPAGPAGYPPAPGPAYPAAPSAPGAAYPPAPSAPMAPPAGATPPAAPPPPPPPPPVDAAAPAPDAWAVAADPLAARSPASRTDETEPPPAPPGPAVDAASGKIERHCSQCGAVIEGSDEFCQACAVEVSGGDHVHAEDGEPAGDGEPKTDA